MADNQQKQQPIIIKKKKGGHGSHGGAWKVAYADFVTAMMAFFLVMWIVGQSEEVRENVAAYFNDPIGFNKGAKSSVLKGAGPAVIPPKITSEMERKRAEEIIKNELKEAADRIRNRLAQMPEFANLKDKIEIEMTAEGLRIQLIESSDSENSTFYQLGSKDLNERGRKILSAIAKELIKLDNKVVIEGHTDARMYALRDNYSNWELSADRANSARKLMQESGLFENRFEAVRGYAANHPRFPKDPFDARNRRIAILVLNDYAESRFRELQESDWTARN